MIDPIIRASYSKGECAIRAASNFVGVVVVLTVVLPIAHRTNLKSASFWERPISAARARIRCIALGTNDGTVLKFFKVAVEPCATASLLLLIPGMLIHVGNGGFQLWSGRPQYGPEKLPAP